MLNKTQIKIVILVFFYQFKIIRLLKLLGYFKPLLGQICTNPIFGLNLTRIWLHLVQQWVKRTHNFGSKQPNIGSFIPPVCPFLTQHWVEITQRILECIYYKKRILITAEYKCKYNFPVSLSLSTLSSSLYQAGKSKPPWLDFT